MKSCSNRPGEIRRARPLLGTFVEITVPAVENAEPALQNAFAAIARVHALMSAHDDNSDLGRLSRARAGSITKVHAWTWRVLRAANRMRRISGGIFDPVVAARLAVRSGRLPAWQASASRKGSWQDVTLLPRNRVRVARAVRFDLGGIAKGFAVDRAVQILRAAGLEFGLVNAGGDLRAFGPRTWPVHVRRPEAPGELVRLGWLRDGAVATSAPYFSQQTRGARTTSALVNARSFRTITTPISATVFAPTCLVADALTKVLLGDSDHDALRAGGAQGLLMKREKGSRRAA